MVGVFFGMFDIIFQEVKILTNISAISINILKKVKGFLLI